MHIPLPKNGHWQRLKHGKISKKAELSSSPTTRTTRKEIIILKQQVETDVNLDLTVPSQNLFQRALIFFDTFIKKLKLRNHEFQFGNHSTLVKMYGENIEVRLREKNRMTKEAKNNWTSATYEPTGV